jgi:hypothetical protein
MVHISFWFMLMMLMYWVEAYKLCIKKTEALLVARKETGLEVNAEKSEYTFMSDVQN